MNGCAVHWDLHTETVAVKARPRLHFFLSFFYGVVKRCANKQREAYENMELKQ